MSRTSFSIAYYCRESKKNKQGQSPLEVSITINKKRVMLNLPIKFAPKDFAKKRKPAIVEETMNTWRIKITQVMNELMNNNIPITVATVKEYIQTGGTKTHTVELLVNKYMEEIKIKVGKSLTQDGYNKYNLVGDFIINEIGKRELCSITTGDMNKLYDRLKSMYLEATSGGKMAKVKSMFQYAFDNGLMRTNPCSQIRINKGKPSVKYLSSDDIKSLKKLDLSDMERLDKVRDLLLFQCGTGVAYADLILFDATKIEKINGLNVYTNNRQKTDIEFTCVVLPDAMKVLDKYNGQLPLISNQKYNKYLKELQQLAKVNTVITTHLLRKTYAHYLLNNGVSIETVSKCLGHTNTNITQKCYCRPTKDLVVGEISKLFN